MTGIVGKSLLLKMHQNFEVLYQSKTNLVNSNTIIDQAKSAAEHQALEDFKYLNTTLQAQPWGGAFQ